MDRELSNRNVSTYPHLDRSNNLNDIRNVANIHKVAKSRAKEKKFNGETNLHIASHAIMKLSQQPNHCLPFNWNEMSDRIELNHSRDNLFYRAFAAQKPLKDGIHCREHNLFRRNKHSLQENLKSNDSDQEIPKRTGKKRAETKLKENVSLTEELTEEMLMAASEQRILHWATDEKTRTFPLQHLIESCSKKCLMKVFDCVKDNIAALINHKYGSHFIFKLLESDDQIVQFLEPFCREHLRELCYLEYACRVLRKLVERSSDFRKFVMSIIKSDLGFFTHGADARYLVLCGILHSETEEERDVISDYITKDLKLWSANRNVKLILMAFIERCSPDLLDRTYSLLQLDRCFYCYLHDRDSCQILLRFMERKHAPTVELFIEALRSDVFRLIKAIFFGYIVGQLLVKEELRYISSRIDTILRSISDDVFRKIASKPPIYLVYSGAVSIYSLALER